MEVLLSLSLHPISIMADQTLRWQIKWCQIKWCQTWCQPIWCHRTCTWLEVMECLWAQIWVVVCMYPINRTRLKCNLNTSGALTQVMELLTQTTHLDEFFFFEETPAMWWKGYFVSLLVFSPLFCTSLQCFVVDFQKCRHRCVEFVFCFFVRLRKWFFFLFFVSVLHWRDQFGVFLLKTWIHFFA